MSAGDCVKAGFDAFVNIPFQNKWQFRYVIAMREIMPEWYGFHVVLHNKVTNQIIDASISAKRKNGGKNLVMNYDKWVKEDGVLVDGKYTYVEWTFGKLLTEWSKEGDFLEIMPIAYERWDLQGKDKQKEWDKFFPEFKNYAEYMKDYFIPTFKPTEHRAMQEFDLEKKGKAS
jgi:hypothetical protein